MYNVNWSNIIRDSLSPRLYTKTIVAWIGVIVQSIQAMHNLFLSYANQTSYKLNHNGQVCYLEAALNDTFDTAERRIYISDAGGELITLINRDTDGNALLINDDPNGGIVIHNDSAYFGGSYDFIVNIPYQFTAADIYQLRALVNYYKLAGKRYDVVVNI